MPTRIRMQADDFFNAYLVLKNNIEVSTHPTMVPIVVCLAFSLELYIKDLHFSISGEAPWGHKIFELFKDLPENIRHEIFSHDLISQNPFIARGNIFSVERHSAYDGFIYHVKAISDGFEKWRYFDESNRLKYDSWFAEALIESIKSVADAVRRRSQKPSP